MSERGYLIFKFYIPEYDVQGRPILIPAEEVYRRDGDLTWAVRRARDIFLRSLQHRGRGETIHPSHRKLWEDDRITWDVKLRKLNSDQLYAQRGLSPISRGGNLRRFATAKERRERFLKEVM